MRRSRSVVFLVMLAVLLCCFGIHGLLYLVDNRAQLPGPRARSGYLDLNTWDLEKDGFLALSDEWMLYEGVLVTPGTDPDVPGVPASLDSFRGKPGVATYRLVLRKTQRESQLMLQGISPYSAAVIYVNGTQVQALGEISPDRSVIRASNEIILAPFADPSELIEIVLHVANAENAAPAKAVLILGVPHKVLITYIIRIAVIVFVIAACLFAGLYALLIYPHRRQNKQHIFFFLICLLAVGNIVMHANGVYTPMRGALERDLLSPMIVILQMYCTTHFVEILYGKLKRVWFTPALALASGILFALSIFLRGVWNTVAWIGMYMLALLAIVQAMSILARAAIAREPSSMIYLVGVFGYALFNGITFFSILWYEPITFTTPVVYGTLVFIVAYAVELNRTYALHFASILTTNEDLERSVTERTSELLTANLRLKSAETARRDMVASISHDLRAPLTSIRGHVELLMNELSGSEEDRQRYLSLIYARTESMEHLVRDLYYFSSLESKSLSFSFRRIPLVPYLEDVFFSFQADVQFQQRSLSMEAQESDARVDIDPERLQQVFINLFMNALRYTPEGGSIVLGLDFAGDEAVIRVSDTGSGIDPRDLPRVFDRFYKASKARGSGDGGSGLGLSIAKGIVEQHGGRVWVESKLGEGTSFYLTLPLLRP